mgnify:CR=1 FL=1
MSNAIEHQNPLITGSFVETEKYKVEFEIFKYCAEYKVFLFMNGDYEDDHEFEVSVKWDGCVNWSLNDCIGHFCSDDDIDAMATMFKRIRNHADDIFNFTNMTFNGK